MGHIKHTIHIDAPADRVVDFTEPPEHWSAFMVGMSQPEKITGKVGVGQQVEFDTVTAGIRGHETLRTVEDRRDAGGGGHWRGEFNGTSSGWISMDIAPEDGGALVIQEMEYTVPGSLLGKVVDRLVFERMQDRDLMHSLDNLKLLMEQRPQA